MRQVLAVALLLCLAAAQADARAWTDPAIDQLALAAQDAPLEGLPIEAARLAQLKALRNSANGSANEVDAQASALFTRIATEFAMGAVDPKVADPSWHMLPTPPDAATLEANALAFGNVAEALLSLLPQHAEYRALRLEFAIVMAEPPGTVVRGLDRDARLDKLRAALERWRWLPHSMPAQRIEVRVPDFHLILMQGDDVLRKHRVVVGRTKRPTPSFEASINSVVLNPYWIPPSSILGAEIVPKLKRDASYADKEGLEVLDDSGSSVDATKVDWSEGARQYHVRQKPGPKNALGRVKFSMSDPYDIYLHDTPELSFFDRLLRTFSHGCIRVKDAMTLARVLLDGAVDDTQIDSALATGQETKIGLAKPVPVFVLYLTAGRRKDGTIKYVADVYKRDASLIAALDEAVEAAQMEPRTNVH